MRPSASRRGNRRSASRPSLALESLESRAVPAVVVAPASLTVPEGQSRAVKFSLNKQPTADVTFTVASSNPAEATIDTQTLTFTPSNWKAAQTVTVSAIEDYLPDGTKTLTLVTSAAQSADPKYASAAIRDVAIKTLDSKKLSSDLYQGHYEGSFSGSQAAGTISADTSGRSFTVTIQITKGPEGYLGQEATGTGTIKDDGSFTVNVYNDVLQVTYKGKIAIGSGNAISFKGAWNLGKAAAGTWKIDRVATPPA